MAYVHPVYHGGKNQPEQVTDNYLTCVICQVPGFKTPKILQCGHTFCRDCLVQTSGGSPPGGAFSCPSCARIHKVPEGGLDALPNNLFINTQVDRLLRRHNKARGRDDTWYNIVDY